MRLARRGFILGGAALLSGCATASAATRTAEFRPLPGLARTPVPTVAISQAPETITAQLNTTRPLDPRGEVRKELMDRALAALDIHKDKITQRDRMYLVDFQKFSGEERSSACGISEIAGPSRWPARSWTTSGDAGGITGYAAPPWMC